MDRRARVPGLPGLSGLRTVAHTARIEHRGLARASSIGAVMPIAETRTIAQPVPQLDVDTAGFDDTSDVFPE